MRLEMLRLGPIDERRVVHGERVYYDGAMGRVRARHVDHLDETFIDEVSA